MICTITNYAIDLYTTSNPSRSWLIDFLLLRRTVLLLCWPRCCSLCSLCSRWSWDSSTTFDVRFRARPDRLGSLLLLSSLSPLSLEDRSESLLSFSSSFFSSNSLSTDDWALSPQISLRSSALNTWPLGYILYAL